MPSNAYLKAKKVHEQLRSATENAIVIAKRKLLSGTEVASIQFSRVDGGSLDGVLRLCCAALMAACSSQSSMLLHALISYSVIVTQLMEEESWGCALPLWTCATKRKEKHRPPFGLRWQLVWWMGFRRDQFIATSLLLYDGGYEMVLHKKE